MATTRITRMRASSSFFFIIFFFLFVSATSAKKKQYKPCKQMVLFFHDIIYNGHNKANATSSIVAHPPGANLTKLADQNHFGDMVIFDDPVTVDNNLRSPPVGRAQGMYSYDGKDSFTAWMGFSFLLNSTQYGHGTINFMGANQIVMETRDLSIVGGTGDFFMHRGIATFIAGAVEGQVYFRLNVDIKFYECW